MTLEDVLKCGSLKALAAIRGLRDDISDEEIVKLFRELEFRTDFNVTWAASMQHLHGTSEIAVDPLTTTFHKFVQNTVMRELNHAEVDFNDLPIYHHGAGRSIMALAMMLEKNAIRADQSKALLKEVLKPANVGVDIEFIICYTDILDEDTSAMDDIIKEVISANPQVIAEFKAGKEKVLGSLIGQVMKKIKGNPQEITAKLKAMI